ncbi:MAG: DnaB-like helicase C-terminal domain-containing protein [Planctomycetota bacterium]
MKTLLVPPHDSEAEAAVLCCVLRDAKAIAQIISIISRDFFYEPKHAIIFEAMVDLFNSSAPIDLITICDRLRHKGELVKVGGEPFLVSLLMIESTAHFAPYYARIIRDRYMLRQFITTSSALITNAYQLPDVRTFLSESLSKLYEIYSGYSKGGEDIIDVQEYVKTLLIEIETRKKEGRQLGIDTGFTILDRWTGGLEAGTLTMIAGRPSMGKTDSLLNLAVSMGRSESVGIITAEMSINELMIRMIAMFNNLNSLDVKAGRALYCDNWYRYLFGNRQIFITEMIYPSAVDIRARVVSLLTRKKISVLMIDHLHKMRWHTNYRADFANWKATVSYVKNIAKDCKIPVILLNQLTRDSDNRRPRLRDLRETGEEDSDIVILLYRENYQQHTTNDVLEWNLAKVRGGSVGVIYLNYNLETGSQVQFEDQSQFYAKGKVKVKEEIPF